MGPAVEAAYDFVLRVRERAVIGAPFDLEDMVKEFRH